MLHECRAHVYRAVSDWPTDKKKETDVKNLGGKIQFMFSHLGRVMTATPSLSMAISIFATVIVILETKFPSIPQFDMNSPTQDKHNELELQVLTSNFNQLTESLPSTLHFTDEYDLLARVNKIMAVNEDPSKQKFLGIDMAFSTLMQLKSKIKFSLAHLHSKGEDKKCGVIHLHIIYDTLTENGNVCPVKAGCFEVKVDLPCSNSIKNPMYFKSAANYLHNQCLKKHPFGVGPQLTCLRLQ